MITLDFDQYLELEKIGLSVFHPLDGFMTEKQFNGCISDSRLPDGSAFSIPIVLDISSCDFEKYKSSSCIDLIYAGEKVGELYPHDFYKIDKLSAAKKIFGTDSIKHPGVKYFTSLREYFVGGPIAFTKRFSTDISEYELTPKQTKQYFKKMQWNRVVGFQTRNVPHRAHEYLQKAALEICDGLLIQPLVGKKKAGDFTVQAVMAGYEALIQNYFPANKVLLTPLSTRMRYAGPREALFHALIRRNYGCTHFIVGRDHAGVGGFYEKYAAHDYLKGFSRDELGIEILYMKGPYYCQKCDSIATEQTCPHFGTREAQEISGTLMREMLSAKKEINFKYMRPEVVERLKTVTSIFIEEN